MRASTLALATLMLAGCSFLFDPSDLMDGERDAGPGVDGAGIDARLDDGGRTDATGMGRDTGETRGDVPCSPAPESWALTSAGAAGAPSITLLANAAGSGTLEATIGFPSTAGQARIATIALDGDVRGTFIAEEPLVDVMSVEAVAVRHVNGALAYVVLSEEGGAAGTSQIWVRDPEDGTPVNLGSPSANDQAGPLDITGEPARYVWNELTPDRQIASLRVDDLDPLTGYNFLADSISRSPGALAASDGAVTVASAAEPGDVLLWNGEGGGITSTAIPHAIPVSATAVVGPAAIAWIGGSSYALAAWDEDAGLEAHVITCPPDGQTTTCDTALGSGVVDAGIGPPVLLDGVSLGLRAAIVLNDGATTYLLVVEPDLTSSAPLSIGSLGSDGALDVDAVQIGSDWHVVVAEADSGGTLHVTDVCITP